MRISKKTELSQKWEENWLLARTDFKKFLHVMHARDVNDPECLKAKTGEFYEFKKHHIFLADRLMEIFTDGRNLVMTVPFRHGKSTLMQYFLLWVLGKYPRKTGWVISATGELVASWANRMWAELMTENHMPAISYFKIFPHLRGSLTSKNSPSSAVIKTSVDGEIKFTGKGGTVTGYGADLIIVDDYYKNEQELLHLPRRDKDWMQFSSTLLTRKQNIDARMIVVQTRWHHDDIIGRLIDPTNPYYDYSTAKNWQYIKIPAAAEKDDILGRPLGEMLWPYVMGNQQLQDWKTSNPRIYEAMCQCRPPKPYANTMLNVENIKEYSRIPIATRRFCGVDLAATMNERSDFSVFVIMDVGTDGRVYLHEKCTIFKENTCGIIKMFNEIHEALNIEHFFIEDDMISKTVLPMLYSQGFKGNIMISKVGMQKKAVRATVLAQYLNAGGFYIPETQCDWKGYLYDHFANFPAKSTANVFHDDFVDACTVALNRINAFIPMQFTNEDSEQMGNVENPQEEKIKTYTVESMLAGFGRKPCKPKPKFIRENVYGRYRC